MRHQAGTRGCFNTQPPEGGWKTNHLSLIRLSSFNTQPPEGGWWRKYHTPNFNLRFQHTAARRRLGGSSAGRGIYSIWFQHTAARRRLDELLAWLSKYRAVSTHSRPKAAGASLKSLAPSGFAALISLSSQEKREREYNTAFSVTPTFAIS